MRVRRHFLTAAVLLVCVACTSSPPANKQKKSSGRRATIGADATNEAREEIRAVIRTRIGAIRDCYEGELKKKPDDADFYGRCRLVWDIDEFGNSENIRITEQFDPTVGSCLAQVIRDSKFPPAKAGMINRVEFPFTFSSQ